MRRTKAILLLLTIMFSLCLPCYAAEISVPEKENIVPIDAYARYISAGEWENIPVVNGNAEITISGYTVTVTNAPSNAAILRVIPIPSTETEAWNWFEECLGSDVTPLSIFDIYFEDAEGNRINADGVRVTITCNMENANVYSVTTEGWTTNLNGCISNGQISFTANGSHYYVLSEERSMSEPSESECPTATDAPTQIDEDGEHGSPATSDNRNFGVWIIILILSATGLLCPELSGRKKRGNRG